MSQRLKSFIYKRLESQYLRLCSPCGMSHNLSSLLLWYEVSHRLYVTNGLNSVPVKLYLQEQSVSCIWLMSHHLLTLALVTERGLVVHNIILFTPVLSRLWVLISGFCPLVPTVSLKLPSASQPLTCFFQIWQMPMEWCYPMQ